MIKLNRYGVYQWHTFYGSSFNDQGLGIAVDEDGNVYVTGQSNATWQGDNNTEPLHAFSGCYECSWNLVVLKLNTNGVYHWHTFYGSANGDTEGRDVAVDANRNVYISGSSSATWQGESNADPLHAHSGDRDQVAVKLNGNGTYQWHTFYGGGGTDYGINIVADGNGTVYLGGQSGATWQGNNNTDPLHPYSGGIDDND